MRIWRGIKNHFVPSTDNSYRPHLLRRPYLLFFLALILATEGFLVANLVARQSDQNFLAAVVPAEIIALTNTERETNNVGDVTEDALLKSAAQAKAEDMAAKGYFSHVGPDGKTPWQWISEYGYKYQYAGENLAVRFIDSSDVVNAWMASPTHRENIVKTVYTKIGVGVAQGLFEGEPATYVVQYFAAPLATAAIPTRTTPAAVVAAPASALAQIPAPTTVAQLPNAQVEGASVSPAPAQSNPLLQSAGRQFTRLLANPQQSSAWTLGIISALLILALVFTFFVRVQVQPANMLMSGAMVAALAISFLAINSRLAEGGATANSPSQAAGAIESLSPSVLIGADGQSTGYTLFP